MLARLFVRDSLQHPRPCTVYGGHLFPVFVIRVPFCPSAQFQSKVKIMPSMHESLLSRYVALPGLLLTSAVGIALIYGNATNQSDSGAFFHYVSENRASSQLVVQILSHLFGAIIILTLTTVLNFRTRILLTEKAISLHSVSWWNQLCNQRLNFGLPWPLSLLLVLFYGTIVQAISYYHKLTIQRAHASSSRVMGRCHHPSDCHQGDTFDYPHP